MKIRRDHRDSRNCGLTYETLEQRQLLAGISLQNINGFSTVVIDGTSSHDVALVEHVTNSTIRVTLNEDQQVFSVSSVERIRFLGRAGNDQFTNLTSINSAAFGHTGNDTLRGGNGNNWLRGGAGDDNLFGGNRNDIIRGGDGDDFIDGGRGNDRLFGGAGKDTISGGDGNDLIDGGPGADTLRGGNGDDRIFGGDGNDFIDGGMGNDRLFGGGGNDQIFGRQGDDIINGGLGNDILHGDAGSDIIHGGPGHDLIFGGFNADQLFGGTGNDVISGGRGNNTIDLGPGSNDVAVLEDNFGDYLVRLSSQSIILTNQGGSSGSITLRNAATLRFADVERSASLFVVNLNEAEVESLRLLNQLRQENNLNALTAIADLSEFANHWSRNVLPNDFRHSTNAEHGSLVIPGRTLYAENIVFVGNSSLSPIAAARRFHELWIDSTTHLSNMTDSRWTEVGVGLVRLSSGWYGTHSFGNS